MKKRIWHLSRCVVACTAFLFVQQFIQSQVSNPSTWESFVQSNANISIRDTFRMQTFEGLPTDNWDYAITGEALIEDISGVKDIPNSHGNYGLRMPMNTQAAFEHFTLTDHQDIKISIRKGGIHLMLGEKMQVKTYRPNKPEYVSIITLNKDDATASFEKTDIGSNPPGLDIIVPTPAANTKNGYYYVDSVYAHGMIPTYSLFTGNSDWNHEDRWSHLPAYRHRNALINGNISINTNISCKDIFIGNGNIHILPTGNLSANNLTIYPNDGILASSSTLRSSGTINISGKITIEKTFAQKGKWYFISFPFDVFASGIDPDFQLGDDKSDTNGNYFYVQTYNGEKRANSQSPSNNWEVIPRTIINTSQPIFKKNKGYLIAIDASADRQNLRFSSKAKDIPIDFGKNGQASIPVSINNQSQNQNQNKQNNQFENKKQNQNQNQNQQEQQPIGQAQPVPVLTVQQPQVQNMLVMVYDPASGQYVQKMMPMQLDPATGNYVPAQAQPTAAPTTTKAQERETEKQRKAAEKAEKERQAEERRKHADELREERAARARKNDSLLGRVQNTAISTATREVTRQVTRGILGGITGLFGGNKK